MAEIKGKGVLFTLGTLILVILILLLGLMIFHSSQDSLERFSEFAISDRAFDAYFSVENGIIEILNSYSDVNVSIIDQGSTSDVSFTETITRDRDKWGIEFSEKIELFKNYVEGKDKHIKIDAVSLEDKELPLVILPHNIKYSRDWATGHVSLDVEPGADDNFNSYDVLVNTGSSEIDNVNSQFGKSGSFSFRVKAVDDYGHSFLESELVDPDASHQVQVFLVGGNKIKVSLSDRELETWTNSDNPVVITTTVDGLAELNESVRVKYATNAISVNYSEFNFSKSSFIEVG